jgi:hypothetical protein
MRCWSWKYVHTPLIVNRVTTILEMVCNYNDEGNLFLYPFSKQQYGIIGNIDLRLVLTHGNNLRKTQSRADLKNLTSW